MPTNNISTTGIDTPIGRVQFTSGTDPVILKWGGDLARKENLATYHNLNYSIRQK